MSLQSIIQQIKTASQPGENTALRVGSAFEQMNSAKRDKTDSLSKTETIDMVNSVRIQAVTGSKFIGEITPITVIPVGDLWGFAEAGTYLNANGIIVPAGKTAILSRVGNAWSLTDVTAEIVQEITNNITNINQVVDPSQIVPSEAIYNDPAQSLAGDILKRVDKETGTDINYREETLYHDGTLLNDSKIDGNIYIKTNNKYYKVCVDGFVNVKLIGAKGDGVTDDTNAIQLALKVFYNIYFPKGEYLCNVECDSKRVIKGDGSYFSRLIPKDVTKAVFTYKNSAPYWTYNTSLEGVGFWNTFLDGTEKKTGVGFTFGFSNVTENVQATQYYNNVVFKNCYFFGFNKAVLTPSGNIGVDFINCGGAGNKYMFYFIDAIRINGEVMHAGNKTVYGGEYNSNDCVCYIENTTEGFGQVIFRNTILEANKIILYSHVKNRFYVPIIFDGCWDEFNGSKFNPNMNIDIDVWTNNVLSVVSTKIEGYILKGNGEYVFKNGRVSGLFADGDLNVSIENCSVEENADYSGASWTVKNGAVAELIRCYSAGGFPNTDNVIIKSPVINKPQLLIGANVQAKVINIPHRSNLSYVRNSYKKVFDVAEYMNGSFSALGAVVSDGILFPNCLEFFLDFSNTSQSMALQTGLNISANKFFIVTVDIKMSVFSNIRIGNDTGQYLGIISNDKERFYNGKWKTLCFVGYSTQVINNDFQLYFSNLNQPTTLRISALQSAEFDSLQEMKGYLDSGVYPI